MSKLSELRINIRPGIHGLLLPVGLFAAVLLLSTTGLWNGIDRDVSDFLLRLRIENTPLPQSRRIIPVDLNDRAERNLGDKVDNREAFVDLFKVLGEGQLRGGIDFLFQGEKDPVQDHAMAEAAKNMDSLVLAVVPVPEALSRFSGQALDPEDARILRSLLWHPKVSDYRNIPIASTFLMPYRELSRSARFLGHIGVTPDSDGLYRKTPLFYRWEDGLIPSLPLALAVADLEIDPTRIEVHSGSEVILPKKNGSKIYIPIDSTGAVWIPYPSTWLEGWKRTPLDKVVSDFGNADELTGLIDQWSDGIVIAADTTTSHKDFGATPLEAVYPLSGIHTSVLNGILTNTFYHSPSLFHKILLGLCFLIGVFFVAALKRDRWFHLGFIMLFAALWITAVLFWFACLIFPWFAAPFLGLAVSWTGAFSLRLLASHEERLLLENALGRYFPRSLAVRIMSEKKTDLRPANKELTILFADIAGFTKWSSDKNPEDVHAFLGDYLESMAAILFERGGTVDKFMGDGILAFFGDPFEQPDHTARCLHAALAMQKKVIELRDKWKPSLGIDLKIRIGVNTGKVIVGNLGSKTRIEYTVIGAAVNLAQRMESNAPIEGILVAKDAWDYTRDNFRFGEVRQVTVKGYDEVIQAFVLEGEID